jgi:CRP-like cAMP-binding protein
MNFDLILQAVSANISLTEEEQHFFTSLLQSRSLKRKELLLREGEVCLWSVFVISGCLRGFTLDKNGFEHVLNFAPPGWWIADMYSLFSQRPGQLNIEAQEETEVLLLAKTNQEILYREVPKFERYFRILVENSLVANQQRLLDNLSLTAEERYRNFCKKYPGLIDKVPQKQVAAYIGVTPEFLSRMRTQMLRQK